MPTNPTNIHLELVQQAVAQCQVVQMHYFSPSSGQFTERSIEPVGTFRYGDAWHVVAYCQLRQGYRNFRLDRMSKLSVSEATYMSHNSTALEAYLEQQSQTTDVTWVKVHFAPSTVSLVKTQAYFHGFVMQKDTSDAVEMSFLVEQEEPFFRWLLQYNHAISMVFPMHWQQAFAKMK